MPVKKIPNNLPQQMTSFIGRERELAEVKAHLTGVRLLTLLGMGGLGKTRLSLQVAAEVMTPVPRRRLVPRPRADPRPGARRQRGGAGARRARRAGPAADPDRVRLPQAAPRAAHDGQLRAPDQACGRPRQRRPARRAAGPRPGVEPRGAARARRADLPGACRCRCRAAATASQRWRGRPRCACSSTARKQHKPAFALNEREAPAVAELVARLEGIPLALELAAARVRSLTVADINARLKDRYKILTGGGRVLLERQQTLRALVDWSYDLLSDSRADGAELGSASSPAASTCAAAEAVCGADPLSSDDVARPARARWSRSRSSCSTRATRPRATGCWRRSATTRARSSSRRARQRRPRRATATTIS